MSTPETEAAQKALDLLAHNLDELMQGNGDATPDDDTGVPRPYIQKAIAAWLQNSESPRLH